MKLQLLLHCIELKMRKSLVKALKIFYVLFIDSVDKRGRPIKKTSKEDLKKFYEIGKEDDAHENGPSLAMEGNNLNHQILQFASCFGCYDDLAAK